MEGTTRPAAASVENQQADRSLAGGQQFPNDRSPKKDAWRMVLYDRAKQACENVLRQNPSVARATMSDINTLIATINQQRNIDNDPLTRDPPELSAAEVRYEIETMSRALQQQFHSREDNEARDEGAARGTRNQRESQATQIIKLALSKCILFHDGEDCFASLDVGDHRENHALKSRAMRRWLGYQYYQQYHKSAGGEAVRAAIETLAGQALFASEERRTYVRVAPSDGKIFLDLCNEDWEVVEIAADGWRVIGSKECPVRFRRARGMRPLPLPQRGGSVAELRKFVNVRSNEDFQLLVSWQINCYRPYGPYPLLVLHGEQGAAKTTTARVLRELIDPNLASLRSQPRDARDLMITASNGWLLAYDNLSSIEVWLSDALCRLATGGGFGTRELYSDSEEVIFDAQRPALLTGIEEVVTRGDLLDRAIIVYLPGLAKRRAEDDFYCDFYSARPRLLGALLDAASCALHNVKLVRLDPLPRMADFAQWVSAAEPSFGWQPGSFIRSYDHNHGAAIELTLDASPVAALLRGKLSLPFEGTATELLTELETFADEKLKRSKSWPVSARPLSDTLRRLSPGLRAIGIETTFERPSRATGARRLIRIQRLTGQGTIPPPSSPGSPPCQNQSIFHDGICVNENDDEDFRFSFISENPK